MLDELGAVSDRKPNSSFAFICQDLFEVTVTKNTTKIQLGKAVVLFKMQMKDLEKIMCTRFKSNGYNCDDPKRGILALRLLDSWLLFVLVCCLSSPDALQSDSLTEELKSRGDQSDL